MTELSLGQRMQSAVGGSVITSLVLTPLDVVRVRWQQQDLLSCECREGLKGALPPRSGGVPEVFWRGCFSGVECQVAPGRYTSTWGALRAIAAEEGLASLWRGLSVGLLMAVPGNMVYLGGYEWMRDRAKSIHRTSGRSVSESGSWGDAISSAQQNGRPASGNDGQSAGRNADQSTGLADAPSSAPSSTLPSALINALIPAGCGALARVLAATAVAPLELLKTRLQSVPASRPALPPYAVARDLWRETRREAAVCGWRRTLFRGLAITLWRDVPFSAIYWGIWETLRHLPESTANSEALPGNSAVQGNSSAQGNFLHQGNSILLSFAAGCIGGTVAAVATQPFDVGKTRWQLERPQATAGSKGIVLFVVQIAKTEGWRALYAGLGPRVAKVAPSCAVMISSYELCKRILADSHL